LGRLGTAVSGFERAIDLAVESSSVGSPLPTPGSSDPPKLIRLV